MKAIFKGTNGSEGFKAGIEYNIKIEIFPDDGTVHINTYDGKDCIYGSLNAFTDNWDCRHKHTPKIVLD